MPWGVEILNETVATEIAALPTDMQAGSFASPPASSKPGWRGWASRM
jgi:hypothetical protein